MPPLSPRITPKNCLLNQWLNMSTAFTYLYVIPKGALLAFPLLDLPLTKPNSRSGRQRSPLTSPRIRYYARLSVAARPAVPGGSAEAYVVRRTFTAASTRDSEAPTSFFSFSQSILCASARVERRSQRQARTPRPSGSTASATPPPPPPHAPLRLRLRQFKSEKQETLHLRSDIQSFVVYSVN